MEEKTNLSVSTFFVTAIAIAAILVLAFLYYYLVTAPVPSQTPINIEQQSLQVKDLPQNQANENSFKTEVIRFTSPDNLPSEIKNGYCSVNSMGQPYREDAWRCFVQNTAYDPCFLTALNDVVYCKINPIQSSDFLIKLTKPLPKPSIPKNIIENWAWFLELEDGTVCSPFTGTRPFSEGQVAYYGCKSSVAGEYVNLLGDIIKADVWMAKKAIFLKSGSVWTIKSSEYVNVKRVWQ